MFLQSRGDEEEGEEGKDEKRGGWLLILSSFQISDRKLKTQNIHLNLNSLLSDRLNPDRLDRESLTPNFCQHGG